MTDKRLDMMGLAMGLIEERDAEIARLRAALDEMLDVFGKYDAESFDDHYADGVVRRARAALSAGK